MPLCGFTAVLGQISKRMPSMSNVFLHYRADRWRTWVQKRRFEIQEAGGIFVAGSNSRLEHGFNM